MKRRHVFRTVIIILGSVGMALWQLPRVFSVIEPARHPGPALGPVGAASPGSARATDDHVLQVLREVAPAAKEHEEPLVVYSPDGRTISEEQRQKLLKEAQRLRPKAPSIHERSLVPGSPAPNSKSLAPR